MSTQATSLPPPPPTFDAAEFRRRLAGLTDPDYSGDDNRDGAHHRQAAIDLCLCLCDLFGDALDRTTLWDRIGSALATACAKCDDGDTDRFASLCLGHCRADAGRAAAHGGFNEWVVNVGHAPLPKRQAFVRYVAGHSFAVLAHARRSWETVKAGRKEAANG